MGGTSDEGTDKGGWLVVVMNLTKMDGGRLWWSQLFAGTPQTGLFPTGPLCLLLGRLTEQIDAAGQNTGVP